MGRCEVRRSIGFLWATFRDRPGAGTCLLPQGAPPVRIPTPVGEVSSRAPVRGQAHITPIRLLFQLQRNRPTFPPCLDLLPPLRNWHCRRQPVRLFSRPAAGSELRSLSVLSTVSVADSAEISRSRFSAEINLTDFTKPMRQLLLDKRCLRLAAPPPHSPPETRRAIHPPGSGGLLFDSRDPAMPYRSWNTDSAE
jgi:hypothetical protein